VALYFQTRVKRMKFDITEIFKQFTKPLLLIDSNKEGYQVCIVDKSRLTGVRIKRLGAPTSLLEAGQLLDTLKNQKQEQNMEI
jgi:hypothetical protein